MFVGHFGLGFGAKKLAPRVSLGTLFLAAQLVDLLWPTFLLLGIESVRIAPGITAVTPLDFTHYPWTHSLAAAVVWGLLFALIHQLLRHSPRSSIVLGCLVFSHWVLDFITHRPDLPITPWSSARAGLGLWRSLPGTLVVELAIFALGVVVYVRATRPDARTGKWSLATLVLFLVVIHMANAFGPPPPSVAAIAWAGQAQWLIVLWGYWIDRHRTPAVVAARRNDRTVSG